MGPPPARTLLILDSRPAMSCSCTKISIRALNSDIFEAKARMAVRCRFLPQQKAHSDSLSPQPLIIVDFAGYDLPGSFVLCYILQQYQ